MPSKRLSAVRRNSTSSVVSFSRLWQRISIRPCLLNSPNPGNNWKTVANTFMYFVPGGCSRIAVFTLFLTLLAACGGGTMSDDQRKKLKEGIDEYKITQVSDSDIVLAAMNEGRQIFETLEKSNFDAAASQRIAHQEKVKVRYITPGKGDALEVENQIIQAYIVGSVTGATQDNIQKLRSGAATSQDYDTLLYSHPIVTSLPDGSVNVDGVWNIYLAKREIVRSLSKK